MVITIICVLSTYREKIQAQNCIRDCERYLNDPNVTSESLKEGLRDLMTKTEDNFGTLLHLERVKNHANNNIFELCNRWLFIFRL